MRGEDVLVRLLGNTMREWEFQILRQELLHVWSLHIVGLLDFHHPQDLAELLESECHRQKGGGFSTHVDGPEPGSMPRSHVLI